RSFTGDGYMNLMEAAMHGICPKCTFVNGCDDSPQVRLFTTMGLASTHSKVRADCASNQGDDLVMTRRTPFFHGAALVALCVVGALVGGCGGTALSGPKSDGGAGAGRDGGADA